MITRNVAAFVIAGLECESCGKDKAKRKDKAPAPIHLRIGPHTQRLCMRCAKLVSDALDKVIVKIEGGYK